MKQFVLFHPDTAIVTGTFSYSGRYVARRLQSKGATVKTLTNRPDLDDFFGGQVPAAPLDFSDPDGLCLSMEGAAVLCNTYWVRFGTGRTTIDQAVGNSKVLFGAAAKAGVGRIVHFSVVNAFKEARLPYFRGKGQVEEILRDTGIPFAIIRPTLVFGVGDLLLNNMTWALRRFPVFPVFGRGGYSFNRSTWVTRRYRQWRLAHGMTASSSTRPRRIRSLSTNCCTCWQRR